MINSIKAEFKKLFTVRSTYAIFAIAFALVILFAFYINGWHISSVDLHDPTTIAGDITGAVGVISIFAALSALLLITHEYRYNTIMYSLTSVNNRSKILISKILIVSGYALLFTAVFAVLSPALSLLGMHLHHLKLVPQIIPYKSLIWHCLFYGWGYVLAASVIATLIRNQVAAIITLFIAPGTIEALLYLLLKNNYVYLPFTALRVVLIGHPDQRVTVGITPFHALLVFMAYLLVSWAVAWVLFLRRDAN